MIHDNKEGIAVVDCREAGDEVHSDCGKGGGLAVGSDGVDWRNCRVSINLGLLADGAALDVFLNESLHAWPPEQSSDHRKGFLYPGVSHWSGFMM